MKIHRVRRIVALMILLISLALLIWGIWPYAPEFRNVPISPADMQLSTPGSFLLDVLGWI
ncbi:MAG: hypothetical protein JXB15_15605 [Anaerolineales bacterium]|nr:hypothetical protein [Anaerolineales bacterium]